MLPAVRTGTNGKRVFYNQVIAAYTGWTDKRNELGKNVLFGDDTKIPENLIKDLE